MTQDRVALGKVGKAHGIAGAFRVWPYADDLERFADLKHVTITRGSKSVEADIQSVRIAPGYVVIETNAIHTPEEVQIWLGGDIEISADDRIELPEGRYFHDQIIGLKVETVDGRRVGMIVQILDSAANDIYVCLNGEHEYMIPAVDAFVKSIDIKSGKMIIDPIPGLID